MGGSRTGCGQKIETWLPSPRPEFIDAFSAFRMCRHSVSGFQVIRFPPSIPASPPPGVGVTNLSTLSAFADAEPFPLRWGEVLSPVRCFGCLVIQFYTFPPGFFPLQNGQRIWIRMEHRASSAALLTAVQQYLIFGDSGPCLMRWN